MNVKRQKRQIVDPTKDAPFLPNIDKSEAFAEAVAPPGHGPRKLASQGDVTGAPAPSVRRVRRRAQEKLRIERAAVELFLERGPDEVTVEDIAAAADISRRTFFRYFPSRDDILVAGHSRAMQRAILALRARPLEESLIEATVNATRSARALLQGRREEIEFADLYQRLLVQCPESWLRVIAIDRPMIEAGFAEAVSFRRRAVGKNAEGAPVIAATLWAISCFVFHEWLKSGGRTDIANDLANALHAVGDALAEA